MAGASTTAGMSASAAAVSNTARQQVSTVLKQPPLLTMAQHTSGAAVSAGGNAHQPASPQPVNQSSEGIARSTLPAVADVILQKVGAVTAVT